MNSVVKSYKLVQADVNSRDIISIQSPSLELTICRSHIKRERYITCIRGKTAANTNTYKHLTNALRYDGESPLKTCVVYRIVLMMLQYICILYRAPQVHL